MTWIYTPFAVILWTTAVILAFVALLVSRRSNTAGVNSFLVLICTMAEWALASGLESASVGLEQKILWSKVEYLGVVTAPMLFFTFVLEYSLRTRWLSLRNILLLSILPIITLVAALTNDIHGLIWNSFTVSPTVQNTIIYGHGIGFYILIAYNYLLVMAGLAILIKEWINSPQPYRRHYDILLIASFFPFVSGIIYTVGWGPFHGLDITPLSFLATGIVLIVGLSMYQLFDLVLITSDALIENMVDGVVVLNTWNRIANVNQVAEKLIDSLSKKSIGQPVEAVLSFWGNIVNTPDSQEIHKEVRLQQNKPRFLDMYVSPLYDRHKHFAGRLITLRDITERRRTETDQARNVEELKIINRINLIIAGGLEMEHILKALYEQCCHVAPIDIFYVALYDPSTSLVNIPLFYEDGQFQVGPSRDIHDQPGIIGNVIQSRQTLYLQDATQRITRPLIRSISKSGKPVHSYLGIPLTVREQVIGVMSIQSWHSNAYNGDQIRLLKRIAIQAAIVIEIARLYAEEQRLAIIDELTEIYNYRGLIELGSREVERARRFGHLLAVLFFDIDDFRNLNNTYSHTAGNLVLQVVVNRCRSILRSVDVLTRFGGDEFVALLPETDLASAEAVARRLVDEVSASAIVTPYGNLSVTISVGVTTLTDTSLDLTALIDRANQAEHRAKQGKKSVVVIAV